MELKAKGVFVQRGAYQPLNVESSSSKPHPTVHSPPTALSKWPPSCARSQRSTTQGGGTRPNEICLSWRCSSHLPFVFFGLSRSGKLLDLIPFQFHRSKLAAKQSRACLQKSCDSQFASAHVQRCNGEVTFLMATWVDWI